MFICLPLLFSSCSHGWNWANGSSVYERYRWWRHGGRWFGWWRSVGNGHKQTQTDTNVSVSGTKQLTDIFLSAHRQNWMMFWRMMRSILLLQLHLPLHQQLLKLVSPHTPHLLLLPVVQLGWSHGSSSVLKCIRLPFPTPRLQARLAKFEDMNAGWR